MLHICMYSVACGCDRMTIACSDRLARKACRYFGELLRHDSGLGKERTGNGKLRRIQEIDTVCYNEWVVV
jgi:hypothetical protein